MSTIQLTSYNRMLRYLMDMTGVSKTASAAIKTDLTEWIRSTSAQIEAWTGREFALASYTEYFDLRYAQMKLRPKALPVTAITSIATDPSGVFDGTTEDTLAADEYHIGYDGNSIALTYDIGYEAQRGMKVVYTGGLAVSGTRTTMVVTPDDTDSFTAGKYVVGGTSGALGLVVSWTSATGVLVVETYRGRWEVAETVTEYTNEDETSATTNTGVVASITSAALCELYPDLARACEMQVRYLYKHKHDFEMVGSTREGVNLRQGNMTTTDLRQPFTPEVLAMLEPWRRIAI